MVTIEPKDITPGWYIVDIEGIVYVTDSVAGSMIISTFSNLRERTIIYVTGEFPFYEMLSPLDKIQGVCDNEPHKVKFLERINIESE